jgi:hypothetical protein
MSIVSPLLRSKQICPPFRLPQRHRHNYRSCANLIGITSPPPAALHRLVPSWFWVSALTKND